MFVVRTDVNNACDCTRGCADHRIFNVHTDVDACDFTRGCRDAVKESALKFDS